ncbi:TlpA family protein disulfide reductase [Campylobacter sp. RM16192]|uniref:TlpA family protein disulfide reductase n=1 Tax=Campylobacter sp. RM16192 TaxID=1660080 RepID=UPI0014514820|nr:TlpA family protein disulfide reductase [Campylobacter sp. RM16192]QCD52283.1 putative periplasmic thioredoxin [Campylobacter sp. RM16192]
MKKIFLAILCVIFLVGCGKEDETAKAPAKIEGYKTGEEIKLASVFGKELTLLRTEGGFVIKGDESKVIMFDIFGTFCPPCQKEAPELMDFQLKNDKDFIIIALTHFENVTNQHVIENFAQKYNAYYFISNNTPVNDKLSAQILEDIKYPHLESVPIKMVLKNGIYQPLTDIASGKFGVHYYLGGIHLDKLTQDFERIKNVN